MITKWGQQNKLNEETSENNMLNDLYSASEHILYLFSTIKSFWLKIEADDNMLDLDKGENVKGCCWFVETICNLSASPQPPQDHGNGMAEVATSSGEARRTSTGTNQATTHATS